MLSDRSYMRPVSGRPAPGFLAWFLGGLVGVFVLQNVLSIWFGSSAFLTYGSLYTDGVRGGKLWTLLTYALLHGSLTHLLANGLGLYFLGRALQDEIGSARLAWLSLCAALLGAVAWLGVNFNHAGNVVGASGIAMAYLAVFACLHPRRPMTILLFFVIPVTIQPIWIVAIFGGIDLFGLLFQELPHTRTLYGVAHSAHLGGLAAGWIFYQVAIVRRLGRGGAAIEPPAWFRRRERRPEPTYTVNLGSTTLSRAGSGPAPAPSAPASRDALRAEVDRILDKINLHGFGSLTPAEKRVLDDARQHLNHR